MCIVSLLPLLVNVRHRRSALVEPYKSADSGLSLGAIDTEDMFCPLRQRLGPLRVCGLAGGGFAIAGLVNRLDRSLVLVTPQRWQLAAIVFMPLDARVVTIAQYSWLYRYTRYPCCRSGEGRHALRLGRRHSLWYLGAAWRLHLRVLAGHPPHVTVRFHEPPVGVLGP